MIQLELPPKPEALNDVLIEELTEQYKKEGTAVWKKDFLVDAVSEIAFGKCCYSECRLGEEGKYVEFIFPLIDNNLQTIIYVSICETPT